MKLAIGIIFLSFAAIGCQNSAAGPSSQSAAPASQSPAASASPEAKYYKGTGKVTKINLEIVSVELNHDEIKGIMPAMIMEFYVKEKSELEVLKVGDFVEFTLEDKAGAERITEIKKK